MYNSTLWSSQMPRVPIRLYWTAVASNFLALGILLRGITKPLEQGEQVVAIVLTSISLLCWIAYFHKLGK